MVAAITRTSTLMGLVPPTRSISRSWSALRIFTCMESGMSPISSRKRVPERASSKRPGLARTAPVKAPRSWPNSSDSSSPSGIAAQFTGMSGPSLRPLSR